MLKLIERIFRRSRASANSGPTDSQERRQHEAMLRQYRQQLKRQHDVFPYVQILTMEDEHVCSACQSEHGRIYHYRKAPRFPLRKCTCAKGCRCTPVLLQEWEAGGENNKKATGCKRK